MKFDCPVCKHSDVIKETGLEISHREKQVIYRTAACENCNNVYLYEIAQMVMSQWTFEGKTLTVDEANELRANTEQFTAHEESLTIVRKVTEVLPGEGN